MKNLLAITLALCLSAPAAHAARRRVVTTPVIPELTIAFVPMAGQSLMGDILDVGDVVGGKVVRVIGVRVERRGGANKGVAVLRAWLEAPDARFSLRVDGKPLSGAPLLIDPQAPLGSTIAHRIEVHVPPTSSEGAVLSAIRWEAATGD